MRDIKLKANIGAIIILIVFIYFVYRAILVWLPNIYSAIEIFIYNKINHIWHFILIATVLSCFVYSLFQIFGNNKFATFLEKTSFYTSIILSMVFCAWVIFNLVGLGNLHYITKLIANSETITEENINEESNGKWVLKVQDFIEEKRLEKTNKEHHNDNKGIIAKASAFIKSEYDAAPEFIQMILYLFGMIIAAILGIAVFIFLTFLWFIVDLLPIILVPFMGLLLLLPIKAVTDFISDSIDNIFPIFIGTTQKNSSGASQLPFNKVAGEKNTDKERDTIISISPENNEAAITVALTPANHLNNAFPPSAQGKKLFLNVPFKEKDEAKVLGARWDPDCKKWYIANIRKYHLFKEWINGRIVVLDHFYIIEGDRTCFSCGQQTPVIGFALEDYLYFFDCEPDVFPDYEWRIGEINITSFISPLPENLLAHLKKQYNYYYDFSKSGGYYYANHCRHCNILQGNNYIFEEVDSPFWIENIEDARGLKLHKIFLEDDIAISADIGWRSNDYLIKDYGQIDTWGNYDSYL